MALIDIVKWETNNQDFCWKFPSSDLRIGTQLVVYPAQTAFFVKGGQVCDEFTAGTYTIKSENLPLIGKLVKLPFGGDSPFQAEVWFVNQIHRLDLKWGTPQPIQLEDPKYGIIVPIRAYGQYGIKVDNPRLFLETLIGNQTSFTADTIDSYFKGKLLSFLSSTISAKITADKVSILEITPYLTSLSEYCNEEINKTFVKYGISLVEFSITSVTVPPEDPSFVRLKVAKDKAAKLNIMGKDYYQMERSFDVLETAAGNTGAGGQILGIGMGLGMNNVLGGMASNTLNTNPGPPPPPQQETWFLYVNGQQLGGQTVQQIAALFNQGVVNMNTLVWKAGMKDWLPLSAVPDLAVAVVPPTPPIPPQI